MEKGGKDRRTMLPQSLVPALQEHLIHVKRVHEKDLAVMVQANAKV
jgi:hypothetical protein